MNPRIQNIISRMAAGEHFYSAFSPRIARAEVRQIERLGFAIQVEMAHGMDEPGAGRQFYPLHLERFRVRARELGLLLPAPAPAAEEGREQA